MRCVSGDFYTFIINFKTSNMYAKVVGFRCADEWLHVLPASKLGNVEKLNVVSKKFIWRFLKIFFLISASFHIWTCTIMLYCILKLPSPKVTLSFMLSYLYMIFQYWFSLQQFCLFFHCFERCSSEISLTNVLVYFCKIWLLPHCNS